MGTVKAYLALIVAALAPLVAAAQEKRQPLAWVGTHRHGSLGENEARVFTHIYRYHRALPPGARMVTLPDDTSVLGESATHDTQERRAELALAAGRHEIRVEYFQWSCGAALELWLGGPQRLYAQVPPELL